MSNIVFPFVGDLFSAYVISRKDDDATPNYYGFVRADGGWYVLRETVSAGNDLYEYAKGKSAFSTNWTNRASLPYVSYDDLTNLP